MFNASSYLRFAGLILFGLLLVGCHSTKQLAEGEILLKKNILKVDEGSVNTYELEGIYKQTANRRPAGVPIFLYIHNSINREKAQRKIIKRTIRINKRNMKRMSVGKDSLEYSQSWKEWFMYTVGEPPVILDTAKIRKTEDQMHLYLDKKGYFNNQILVSYQDSIKTSYTDSLGRKRLLTYVDTLGKKHPKLVYGIKKDKANVMYNIKAGKPYKIISYKLNCYDKKLEAKIYKALRERKKKEKQIEDGSVVPPGYRPLSKVAVGQNFDMYLLDAERERITKKLRDEDAYFKFIKEYITFTADTTVSKHGVALEMNITEWREPHYAKPDSTVTRVHRIYKIKKVTFVLDSDPSDPSDANAPRKSLVHIGPDGWPHTFLYKDTFDLDLDLLIVSNFLRPTHQGYWKEKYVERSYKRLLELGLYRSVNIKIEEADFDHYNDGGFVNVTYFLTPSKVKSLSLEGRGVHNSGFLGIEGTIVHVNKNLGGGAENLTVSITGGIEAQQTLTGSGTDSTSTSTAFLKPLNTFEIGPEIKLQIPSIAIIPKTKRHNLSRSAMPFTEIATGFSFQKRPDYTRSLFHFSHTIKFSEMKKTIYSFTLPNFSYVIIDKDPVFQAQIDELNDQFLANSYDNHLILEVFQFKRTYDTQRDPANKYNRNKFLHTVSLDYANKGLFFFNEKLHDQARQFVLIDTELRYFRRIKRRMGFASRFAAGFGQPIKDVGLPFLKSFFTGGANTLRAWKARSVGPGTYFDPDQSFDKIGDIRIEGNLEYRFHLIGLVDMALFVDAGNIWLITDDPLRPQGKFKGDRFYKEFAIGGGVGLRLDLTFFVIRADLGIPLHDPALPDNERWLWQGKDVYESWPEHPNRYLPNLNIGIGYPF